MEKIKSSVLVQLETAVGHPSGDAGQAFLLSLPPPTMQSLIMSAPWWLMLPPVPAPVSSSLSLDSTIQYPYKIVGCRLCPPFSPRVLPLLYYACNFPHRVLSYIHFIGAKEEKETHLPSVLVSVVTSAWVPAGLVSICFGP